MYYYARIEYPRKRLADRVSSDEKSLCAVHGAWGDGIATRSNCAGVMYRDCHRYREPCPQVPKKD